MLMGFFFKFSFCCCCWVFFLILKKDFFFFPWLQGTRFNQVISEPKTLESHALFWYPSTLCYDRWRLFVYQCLTCCTGPCITNYFAAVIGYLTFLMVWVIQPFCRLQETCVESLIAVTRPLCQGHCSCVKKAGKAVLKGVKDTVGVLVKKSGSILDIQTIELNMLEF